MTESQVRLTTSDAVGDDCYPRLIDHLVATLIHADLGAYCDHRDVARAWQPRTAGHRNAPYARRAYGGAVPISIT